MHQGGPEPLSDSAASRQRVVVVIGASNGIGRAPAHALAGVLASPEKVAAAIVRALDRPRREVSLGLANPVMVLGFRALPAAFDVLVTPLMQRASASWIAPAGPPRVRSG